MEQLWPVLLTSSCLSPPPRMALTSEPGETPGVGWYLKLQAQMLGNACVTVTALSTHCFCGYQPHHLLTAYNAFRDCWYLSVAHSPEHVAFHFNHLADSLTLEKGAYCWWCEMPS